MVEHEGAVNLGSIKSHSVVITISKTVSDVNKLWMMVYALKKRFGVLVSLIFKEPELLFFNKELLRFVSDGNISRIVISDRPDLFFLDVIELAKRQEGEAVSVLDADRLGEEWLSFVRHLIVDRLSPLYIISSRENGWITFERLALLGKDSKADESFFNMVRRMTGKRLNSEIKPNDRGALSYRASLFVTQEGISRFGSKEKFLNSCIRVDGLRPAEFRRVWVVNNKVSLSDYFDQLKNQVFFESRIVEIPGVITGDRSLLVDIYPAAINKKPSSEVKSLNAPRCILSLTLSDLDVSAVYDETRAVFVMSNFNKESFIFGALYSVAMQSHPNVCLEIIDDASTDCSVDLLKDAIEEFDSAVFPINVKINTKNKGTYWIRNQIINSLNEDNVVYFVSDSDDFSSSQRAGVQITILNRNPNYKVVFGDIVRVDHMHRILSLNGKVERYGTASLASPTATHNEYGYYENIMKNADTEYIERLKHFAGKSAVHWFRYPVLFQPFDGTNLTSDIYNLSEGSIRQKFDSRKAHFDIFRALHARIRKEDLPKLYMFDCDDYPDYSFRLLEFLGSPKLESS